MGEGLLFEPVRTSLEMIRSTDCTSLFFWEDLLAQSQVGCLRFINLVFVIDILRTAFGKLDSSIKEVELHMSPQTNVQIDVHEKYILLVLQLMVLFRGVLACFGFNFVHMLQSFTATSRVNAHRNFSCGKLEEIKINSFFRDKIREVLTAKFEGFFKQQTVNLDFKEEIAYIICLLMHFLKELNQRIQALFKQPKKSHLIHFILFSVFQRHEHLLSSLNAPITPSQKHRFAHQLHPRK